MSKNIMIKDARCSFPQLWHADKKDDGENFGMGITLILQPAEHGALITEIKSAIKEVIKESDILRKSPPSGDRLCLRGEGGAGWREEYGEGSLILKAGCARTPVVLFPDMSRAREEDDPIYSGCRVNVKVNIWAQANKYGKRVNAKLLAIQFNRDDESFDGSFVSESEALEGFGSLEDSAAGDFESDDFLN